MLLELAEELLVAIISHLGVPQDEPPFSEAVADFFAMCNLALTNKALKRLVEPALYYKLDSRHRTVRRMRRFLDTLLERPELRENVRVLLLGDEVLDGAEDEDGDGDEDKVLPIDRGNAPFDLHVSEDLANELSQAIFDGDPEAEATLLVALCPRLTGLSFHFEIGFHLVQLARNYFEEVYCHHALKSSRDKGELQERRPCDLPLAKSFRDLRDVEAVFDWCLFDKFAAIFEYYPLLSLPAIKTFRTRMVADDNSSVDYQNSPIMHSAFTSTVEDLTLGATLVTVPTLSRLITSCPALRKLQVHWNFVPDAQFDLIECQRLGPMLREHGTQLEHLTLDFDVGDDDDWQGIERLGDLRALTRLRKFVVSEPILLGEEPHAEFENDSIALPRKANLVDLLPTSLESLTALFCRGDEKNGNRVPRYLDQQVAQLVADERFVSLRRVELHRPRGYEYEESIIQSDAVEYEARLPIGWHCGLHPSDGSEYFRLRLVKGSSLSLDQRSTFPVVHSFMGE
ncbi:hypothetical protein MBLNU230_g6262t1 [Neophaeotheca triangularis]